MTGSARTSACRPLTTTIPSGRLAPASASSRWSPSTRATSRRRGGSRSSPSELRSTAAKRPSGSSVRRSRGPLPSGMRRTSRHESSPSPSPARSSSEKATARRLDHRFVFEPLGDFDVKGRAAPVSVFTLVGPKAREPVAGATPVVGRDAEMAQLMGALGELVAGRGRVVLLVGDPGMGKTRLLTELRELAEDRVVWLEGHCLSYGGLSAWPFVEALLGWLGADIGEAEIAVRTKARAKLGALLGSELDDVLPSLGRLLRLRVEATEEAGSAERIREAYVRWLEAVARQQPVVVALEDVHWADAQTRELAEAVLDLTERAPVALLLTEEIAPGSEGAALRLRALGEHGHRTTQIALGPLPDDAAERDADRHPRRRGRRRHPHGARAGGGGKSALPRGALASASRRRLGAARENVDDLRPRRPPPARAGEPPRCPDRPPLAGSSAARARRGGHRSHVPGGGSRGDRRGGRRAKA